MKNLLFFIVFLILIAGCSKKQPQVQSPYPQKPVSEAQPAISVKKVPPKLGREPVYPVRYEKQFKTPDWVKEVVSIYEKNYGLWREKTSTDTSSVLIASLTSSSIVPSSSITSGSSTAAVSIPSSTAESARPSSIVKSTTSSAPPPASLSASAIISSPVSAPSNQPPPADSGSDTNPQQPSQPDSQNTGVNVVRTIQNTGDSAYIRLSVNVTDTRVNGIIVTENLPDGYTLVSASPVVSKRTGNSIKWLFYGTSLTSQVINYEIKGSGRASISGSFSSTLGSGTTTGDSQLGQ